MSPNFSQHGPCIATFVESVTTNIVQSRGAMVCLSFKCELPSLPTVTPDSTRQWEFLLPHDCHRPMAARTAHLLAPPPTSPCSYHPCEKSSRFSCLNSRLFLHSTIFFISHIMFPHMNALHCAILLLPQLSSPQYNPITTTPIK